MVANTTPDAAPVVQRTAGTTPAGQSVLFVCVKNGGKSQMAAGLMRERVGDSIDVSSAGTQAGDRLNVQSVDSLQEWGIDISGQHTRQLTADMVAAADLVVVLGRDARVSPSGGTPVEVWDTDEPSERGIEGMPRMRLVRDDIAARVDELADRLSRKGAVGPVPLRPVVSPRTSMRPVPETAADRQGEMP